MTNRSADEQSLTDFLAAYEPPPEDYEAHQELLRHVADSQDHFAQATAPVIADLRDHGYNVQAVGDLDQPGVGDGPAVQVLLDHLPGATDVSLIIELTKPLRSAWARDTAVRAVAHMYLTITDETDPTGQVRFYLGDTLERIADDSVAEQMLGIAQDRDRTDGGRGLVVMGLARLKKSRDTVVPVLLNLLDDTKVGIYAAIALGKLKEPQARAGIERLTHDDDSWVRQKAKQALAKLPNS